MKKILVSLIALVATVAAQAAPSLDELVGDYVLLNYFDYDGSLMLKEMRNFSITKDPEVTNGIILTNFYITQADPIKAKYTPSTGVITIAAGTVVFEFNDGTGSSQYLYGWNAETEEVVTRNITFRMQGSEKWECSMPLVLMVGVIDEGLTPYIFSAKSEIRKANATTHDISHVYSTATGTLVPEFTYDEDRPSFIMQNDAGTTLSIFNLLTTDSYGYGCRLDLYIDAERNVVYSGPTIVGEMKNDFEYPYKTLAGCTFDNTTHVPTGASYAGTTAEGMILGSIDRKKGKIVLNPCCIYPTAYDEQANLLTINYRSVYEALELIEIDYDVDRIASVDAVIADATDHGKLVGTDYYSITGQRLSHPAHGSFAIKVDRFADGARRSSKVIIK